MSDINPRLGTALVNKMVPVDALRELSRGSFEHLSLRLDEAIADNQHVFIGRSNASVARIATFSDHVLVGSSDGEYFKAQFEDIDGRIKINLPQRLDVPVIENSNASQYIRDYTLGVVDSILSGNINESSTQVLSLVKLYESTENDGDENFTDVVIEYLNNQDRQWRKIYSEQYDAIINEVQDIAESINQRKLVPRYVPLYDGTIPEEKFESYRESAMADLGIVAERLEKAQTAAETVFLPFTEAVTHAYRTPEDEQVLSQFDSFANSYFEDIQGAREHLAHAIKNEECVMCLGQIHDAFVEALTDYEIAGSFVERMASRFIETK